MNSEVKQSKFEHEVSASETVVELSEQHEQRELIDELQDYLPDLETIRHKEVAQKLIGTAEEAALDIEEELELAKKKLEYLSTLDVRAQLSESEGFSTLDFDDLEKQLLFLADIYDSKNPYQSLLTKLPQDKLKVLQEQNPDLQIYRNEFGAGRQLTSLVWKRDEHQRKVNRAEKLAKNLIAEQIVTLLDSIQGEIKQVESSLHTRGERPEELYRKYCLADSDSADPVSKQLEDKLSSYRSIIAGLPKMEKFISFLQTFDSRCEGKFDWKVNSVVYGVAEFKKGLSSISDSLDKERKFSSPSSRLNSAAEQKKRKIRMLFEVPNPHGGSVPIRHEREQWSITKEFLQAIKKFNKQIKKAEQHLNIDVGEYESYYYAQIQAAQEISKGRLLTHAAPTAVMYQILERGDLSSISEQESKHKTKKRTHAHPLHPELEARETHDVCFNIDSVYGNFSDTEGLTKPGGRIKADIVLILSENHILDRRQFVDMDGRHIFDENYSGDSTESPGFSVNLQETPFMLLVSESQKAKTVQFLKEKSVFKEQLAGFDEQQLQEWIDKHILIVPSIDGFRFTPDVKQSFFQAKNIKPIKGFVELTDTEASFKSGPEKTKQFFATAA